ncbi:hypothetical protein COT78_02390 [Candidatus Berkelbacteria bacterium CG10_big_fil_rev_8_21_14_0_10_43_13]|uniref:CRISPR-associated endoribonuclease Cas2 n=1 Tax=Candidatus Berkelbacteria bacterium CG10_big_fil_rev_8_21_14_0_10_43_13 TaxID=1974514 RepID=A0A2H0W8J6_9BACT|nr:MAG: hypothetical protein COT78_02390 [Candidatus Berkelbacteria bacterium CG10_big_fil_rev_8_21_14_0_10_43_13]
MKKDSKKKVKNFTVEVLDFLLNIPDALAYGFDRGGLYRLMNDFPYEQTLTCSKISHIFSNLKNRGYIEVKKHNGQESVVFTNKAKLAVIDKIAERSDVDNKYYIVSFDIPERMRIDRNKFRRTIKRLGFRQIQKSLWVTNKNFGEYVELAAYEYGVEKYVVYFVTDNTNISGIIDKMLERVNPDF